MAEDGDDVAALVDEGLLPVLPSTFWSACGAVELVVVVQSSPVPYSMDAQLEQNIMAQTGYAKTVVTVAAEDVAYAAAAAEAGERVQVTLQTADAPESEVAALRALKEAWWVNGTEEVHMFDFAGWNRIGHRFERDPCSYGWLGVACDADGHVTYLELAGVSGALADVDWTALPKLRSLRFRSPAVMTGELPASLQRSSALRALVARSVGLSGTLDDGAFGGGTGAMAELDLQGNALSGALPPSLFELPALRALRLSKNALTGALPTSLGASLVELRLSDNHLRGRIPAALPAPLELLALNNNTFTGFVDYDEGAGDSWAAAVGLSELYLQDNALEAPMPEGLGSLSRLSAVDLSRNPDLGRFYVEGLAASLAGGSSYHVLRTLQASRRTLRTMAFSHCLLTGKLNNALDLNELERLEKLDLSKNYLSGPLPAAVAGPLASLDLSRNSFYGAVPPVFGLLPTLSSLRLHGNAGLNSRDLALEPVPPFFVKSGNATTGALLCPLFGLGEGGERGPATLDASYHNHTLCECELGYYPDPSPPHCTEFLSEYTYDAPTAIVSDGSMSDRIRDGLDVNYVIEAAETTRAIVLSFGSLGISAAAGGSLLNVHSGRTRRDKVIASPTSEDVERRAGEPYYVFGSTALLHFLSEDSGGPYFNVSYETSDQCPTGYAFDEAWGRCQSTRPCAVGQRVVYSSEGERACTSCEIGTYQDVPTAAQQCKQCPADAITLDAGSTSLLDCVCKDNFVGERGGECLECSAEGIAFCPGRERGNLMAIKEGYYKAAGSYEVYSCPAADACQETEGIDLLAASNCSTGSGGPLCEVCVDNYYKISGTGCLKCGPKDSAYAVLVLLCLMPIVAYALIFRISDPHKHVVNVKIVISFAQSVYIFSSFAANWPSVFQDFISIFGFVNLDLVELSSPQCALGSTYSYFDSFFFYIAVLPAEVTVIALHYYIRAWFITRADGDGDPQAHAQRIADWRARCWRVGLFMTTLTYPGVATKLVQFFNCKRVAGINYLQADYMVVCGEGEHEELFPVAVLFTALIVAGYPLALLSILVRKQLRVRASIDGEDEGKDENGDAVSSKDKDVEGGNSEQQFKKMPSRRLSAVKVPNRRASAIEVASAAGASVTIFTESRFIMLTEDYRDSAMYWEVTEMIRKLILSLVPVLAAYDDREQLISAAVISLVWLQATATVRPYKMVRDQIAQTIGLFVPIFTLLLGMFGRTDVGMTPGSAGRDGLSGTLVTINSVAMLVIACLGVLGIENKHANRVLAPIARLFGLDTAMGD